MDQAYSATTGTTYPSWEALLAAETNGYVVVGLSTRPDTHPVICGPYPDKETARRAQARLRRRWKREEAPKYEVSTFVRHLWKDPS